MLSINYVMKRVVLLLCFMMIDTKAKADQPILDCLTCDQYLKPNVVAFKYQASDEDYFNHLVKIIKLISIDFFN